MCEKNHGNRGWLKSGGDGQWAPLLLPQREGALWLAAIPSLGTLYASATTRRWGTRQEGGPIPVGGGPVLSRKHSCALRKGALWSGGGPVSVAIDTRIYPAPEAVTHSQAQVQLLYRALPPGGRPGWTQPLQEGQRAGEPGRNGMEWGQRWTEGLPSLCLRQQPKS